jgi:hypothetical protein
MEWKKIQKKRKTIEYKLTILTSSLILTIKCLSLLLTDDHSLPLIEEISNDCNSNTAPLECAMKPTNLPKPSTTFGSSMGNGSAVLKRSKK